MQNMSYLSEEYKWMWTCKKYVKLVHLAIQNWSIEQPSFPRMNGSTLTVKCQGFYSRNWMNFFLSICTLKYLKKHKFSFLTTFVFDLFLSKISFFIKIFFTRLRPLICLSLMMLVDFLHIRVELKSIQMDWLGETRVKLDQMRCSKIIWGNEFLNSQEKWNVPTVSLRNIWSSEMIYYWQTTQVQIN